MEELKIGVEFKVERIVSDTDTASSYGSGGLEVYATPAMAALMEQSAYTLLKKCGAESVGTALDIKHTRACLPGTKVWAVARITGIAERRVDFVVTAFDAAGEIGNGTHTRFIIDPERFMAKLHK